MIPLASEIALSPEFTQQAALHKELRDEFATLLVDRDTLVHTVKTNIETDYQLKIGGKQYALFMRRIESLRLKRKLEILQAAVNRGEMLEDCNIEDQLDKEFAEWQRQANDLLARIEQAEFNANLPLHTAEGTAELKKLYRALAKKIHPDLNPGQSIDHANLWLRVVDAYSKGNLQELRILTLMAEDFRDESPSMNTLEKLKQNCQRLRDGIMALINQLAQIKAQFPFPIAEQLKDEAWVLEQNREMDGMIIEWQKSIKQYQQAIEELTTRSLQPQIIH